MYQILLASVAQEKSVPNPVNSGSKMALVFKLGLDSR